MDAAGGVGSEGRDDSDGLEGSVTEMMTRRPGRRGKGGAKPTPVASKARVEGEGEGEGDAGEAVVAAAHSGRLAGSTRTSPGQFKWRLVSLSRAVRPLQPAEALGSVTTWTGNLKIACGVAINTLI